MGLQRFPIPDFSGGLNTADAPFELNPNEAQDLLNVSLTERGALKTREGKVRFDSAGFPAGKRCEHMRNWYPNDGSRFLICSIDGGIYKCDGAGALTLWFGGTAGTVWCFEQGQDSTNADRLWAMNGVDPPKKIQSNGTVANWANAPPNGTMMRMWRNKMVVAGVAAHPQRLYYANEGDPETPAATYGETATGGNWIDVRTSDDDLDPITWIEILGDVLIVFKKRSTYAIYDPVEFGYRRIGRPGCEGRFQSAVVAGNCYFFARDGVYSTNAITVEYVSLTISNWFKNNLNFGALTGVRMASSRDRRVFVAVPVGTTYNNRLLELNTDLRARIRPQGRPIITSGPWVLHDFCVASMASFRAGNLDEGYAGASDTNRIHVMFKGTNDDGVAIKSYWLTGWRGLITEEPFERIRRVNVEFGGRVKIDLYSDLDTDVSRFSGVLNGPVPTDPYWDGGVWDGGTWDPVHATVLDRLRPEVRARYHALKFSNDVLDQNFQIYTVELALRGGKEHT